MENLTRYKAKLTQIGNSKYVIVPNNYVKFEGLEDDEVVEVTIRKIIADDETDTISE